MKPSKKKSIEDRLACPCCGVSAVHPDLIDKLERMDAFNRCTLTVTSGYRCKAHNDDLKKRGYNASPTSEHLVGCALDVAAKDGGDADRLAAIARQAGFKWVKQGSVGGRPYVHCGLGYRLS